VSKRYLLKRMTEDESAIWKRREGGGRRSGGLSYRSGAVERQGRCDNER
jgi:hypothetical protein